MEIKANILDEKAISRAITRISHEIIEKNKGVDNIVILGIKTRGMPIAQRISKKIEDIEGVKVAVEEVDVSNYRDDVDRHRRHDEIQREVNLHVKDKVVVLVDDVLYTGRTVRSALDYIIDYGRPRSIQLAVLIDRGHRELPIRADYVGKNVPTSRNEQINVRLKETDTEDSVNIVV